jgi:hypothetical protein
MTIASDLQRLIVNPVKALALAPVPSHSSRADRRRTKSILLDILSAPQPPTLFLLCLMPFPFFFSRHLFCAIFTHRRNAHYSEFYEVLLTLSASHFCSPFSHLLPRSHRLRIEKPLNV